MNELKHFTNVYIYGAKVACIICKAFGIIMMTKPGGKLYITCTFYAFIDTVHNHKQIIKCPDHSNWTLLQGIDKVRTRPLGNAARNNKAGQTGFFF